MRLGGVVITSMHSSCLKGVKGFSGIVGLKGKKTTLSRDLQGEKIREEGMPEIDDALPHHWLIPISARPILTTYGVMVQSMPTRSRTCVF